jgi:PAS domain S-box-containing protein
MIEAPVPQEETQRLKALKAYEVLDTPEDPVFDEITKVAAHICGTKMSLITFVDGERQWFKSHYGITSKETPRNISFCGHTILDDKLLIVEDSAEDPRFHDNPLFINEPHIRFYAGAPLITPDNQRIGTLCVSDTNAKSLNENQKMALQSLARQVINYLEINKKNSELEKLKKFLSDSQSIAKIGSWIYNAKLHQMEWSDELYRIFEIAGPVSSDNLREIFKQRIHPDDLGELETLRYKALTCGENYGPFDFRLTLDDGNRIKYVQEIAESAKDSAGNVIALRGSCRDRSKDVEHDSRFERLLDNMVEGLVVHAADGSIIEHNRAAYEILGLTEGQLLGKDSMDPRWKSIREDGSPFPGEEHPAMVVLRTGREVRNVTMGVNIPGQDIRWIKINAIPINTADGKNVIATFSNITNYLKTEKENRFILDTLGLAVWKFNPNDSSLDWDDSMFRLYEINPAEFTGHKDFWLALISDKDRTQISNLLKRTIQGSAEFNAFYEIQLSDGNKKILASKATMTRNSAGEPLMMYGISWDITKEAHLQKKLEDEKLKSFHMAKLASVGELAAGIGHEINNPLAIAKIALSNFKEGVQGNSRAMPADAGNMIDVMENALDRVGTIVQGLRTFSRTEGNAVVEFDVIEVIEESIKMIGLTLKGEQATIDFQNGVAAGRVLLLANKGKIQQVLMNLLSNARDAIEDSEEKKIIISTHVSNSALILKIKDFGCGIPEQDQAKIFDPFFTTKDIKKGTGIGLSLVHEFVDEAGGSISFTSREHEGSEFIVELPVHRELSSQSHPAVENKVTPVEAQETQLIDAKVLVVDDEEALRDMLGIILENFGMHSTLASNGRQAYEEILKKPDYYDIVVSDMKMPEMDGPTLLSKIRENSALKQPKFIFVTGGVNVDFSDKNNSMRKLIDGYLMKPFESEDVYAEIKKVLQ